MDFKIKVGELNKRITIQKYTITTNDNGFDEETWVDYKTISAKMNNLFGKEYYAAMAVRAENTIEFVVRYSKDLESINTKEYRIRFTKDSSAVKEEDKYKFLNITSMDNIQYGNAFFKIKAIETI